MTNAALKLLGLIRAARAVLLPPSCRFEPTCSAYAEQTLSRLGIARSLIPIAGRLLRCHPFHPGGIDPAPTI